QCALFYIRGNKLELVKILFAKTTYQCTGASTDVTLNEGLPLDHRNGELDTLDPIYALDEARIIIKRPIHRLHDKVAIDTQNAVQKLGTKPVHHRHNDDERGNTKHDASERKTGNDRDKRLAAARSQIAPCD